MAQRSGEWRKILRLVDQSTSAPTEFGPETHLYTNSISQQCKLMKKTLTLNRLGHLNNAGYREKTGCTDEMKHPDVLGERRTLIAPKYAPAQRTSFTPLGFVLGISLCNICFTVQYNNPTICQVYLWQ